MNQHQHQYQNNDISNVLLLLLSGKDVYTIITTLFMLNSKYIIDKIVEILNIIYRYFYPKKENVVIVADSVKFYEIVIENIEEYSGEFPNKLLINSLCSYLFKMNSSLNIYKYEILYDNEKKSLMYYPTTDTEVMLKEDIYLKTIIKNNDDNNNNNDKTLNNDNNSTNNNRVLNNKTRKSREKQIVYVLKSTDIVTLRKFIEEIVDDYYSRYYKIEKYNYLYGVKYTKNGRCLSRSKLTYKRTFDSLFFDNKKRFLRLLDNFSNKKGPYSFNVPYKLGILLYGKPGSGKTTFIKALSATLNRHIITLNLSNIKTNTELEKIIYRPQEINTSSVPFLEQKNVIYIIEDIDCCGKIVTKRSDEYEKIAEIVTKRSDGYEKIAEIDSPDSSVSSKKNEKDDDEDDDDDKLDKLNLSGLLNIIDGVNDNDGRIIIFTTNHPEMLDPALIRPGRVDIQIEMNNLNKENLKEMFKHFGLLTPEQLESLDDYNIQKTGSEIENFIIEHFENENIYSELLKLSS